MARSLGLTAYRTLKRGGDTSPPDLSVPRPVGELLWLYLADPESRVAVTDLALRIGDLRDGLNVLITLPDMCKPRAPRRLSGDGWLIETCAPSEHLPSVTTAIDHWRPDICLWTWGGLRPNLIVELSERGVPMILANADSAGFDGRRDRWMPELSRDLLTMFGTVLARDDAARTKLLNIGLPAQRITQSDPLQPIGHALPVHDDDVTDFSASILGRTVWYANGVHPKELATIFSAHRIALRSSHRLLLIIRPTADLGGDTVLKEACRAEFRAASWDAGDYPDEATQVLVTEDPGDAGIFYRVAPVSFMGGSLKPTGEGVDPFEAAALGSAVLYGPKVGPYVSSYSQLAAAGAGRIVNDAQALGNAVSRLILPDQAAMMAHAGWDVISRGAGVADQIAAAVQDALDDAKASS